jgi:hypothetical protein
MACDVGPWAVRLRCSSQRGRLVRRNRHLQRRRPTSIGADAACAWRAHVSGSPWTGIVRAASCGGGDEPQSTEQPLRGRNIMRFRGLGLRHRLCPALGLAVGLGIVVGVSPTTPAAAASAGVPRFEPAPCPDFPVPELARARCGYLVVLENRARPTAAPSASSWRPFRRHHHAPRPSR